MSSARVLATVTALLATATCAMSFNLADHPYIAPGPGDQRSPCPALSTLANHGLINRDGKNISANALGAAAAEAFSMSPLSVNFVMEKNIELGLPFVNTTDDLFFDLRFTAVVDRDVSFGWLDREFRNFGADEPNKCLIDKFLSLNPDSDFLTPDDLEEFIKIRYHDSKKHNGNFKFVQETLELMGVQIAEMFTVSNDPNLEVVNKTVLYEFLLNNRFPDGYEARNATYPWQLMLDETDPSALLIKRYTALLTELNSGDAVVAMETAEDDEAMCIHDQPPPLPTEPPVESPSSPSSSDTSPSDSAYTAVSSTWNMGALFVGTTISMVAMLF